MRLSVNNFGAGTDLLGWRGVERLERMDVWRLTRHQGSLHRAEQEGSILSYLSPEYRRRHTGDFTLSRLQMRGEDL
jgi:hypothetical protein